ncbi:MAG: hypothetical protein A2Z03_04515 [Chloroflexi bacterium RBG_16_56_8]|nr:MAG: hypothetical protein A2Z03_04515 [Chloroflexi bacterium RBG_16_56_8]
MGALDFLNPINTAVSAAKSIVEIWSNLKDKKDRENSSIAADLTDLMEELRKTHSTIVKLVSPLRRIPDNHATFGNDFVAVYNDFRDFYDAFDFGDARTHCHKIRQIRTRMARRQPRFGTNTQWQELFSTLHALDNSDLDVIEHYYKPFTKQFDSAMNGIYQRVQSNEIPQAISEKNAFLASLGPEYDKNKAALEEMTDLVGELTAGL